MQPNSKIYCFLKRIQTKWNQVLYLQLTYLVLTIFAGGALATGLYFYFQPANPVLSYGLCGGIALILSWRLYSTRKVSKISQDQAALLAENKFPELNNALINASQLERQITDYSDPSISFIREHLKRTQSAIENLDPDSVVGGQKTVPQRNFLLLTLVALIAVTWALPGFWEHTLLNSTSPELAQTDLTEKEKGLTPAASQLDYKVDGLSLILEYPAYTQLVQKVINPSDGSIKALPGTEVKITGISNHPVEGAELVINKHDHFLVELNESKTQLKGSFNLSEKGHYHFKIKQPDGTKISLEQKYPLELVQDKSPQVILFPANPKPVYYETDKVQIFYEAHDDYGLKQIDLIVQVNETPLRKSLKRFKQSEKDATGDYSWNLNLENLQPGDEVQYFLETKDNDNVLGPNTGQSEIYRFTIFDSRKEREDLLRLQEELTEKMITLLASGLVEGEVLSTSAPNTKYGKKLLASQADALIDIIGLAQRIKSQAKDFERFPRPYLTLLNNIIKRFTSIRQEQIDTINKMQGPQFKPTPVSFKLDSVASLNDKMVYQLEQNILYLIKMTNRQKMDQARELEKQLSQLTDALQEEFENIRDKKSPSTPDQIKSKLNEIQKTLQKMMDQLSRQTQSKPDEFLNSKAYKNMNLEQTMASLEKVMNLADQGKIEEALEELKKVAEKLRELGNQLDQADSAMDSMVDNQTMEKINESMMQLESMEKQQKEIIQETSEINQKLRADQAKQFESLIKSFFDELKKDVQAIQSILENDSRYLDEHKAMIKTRELIKEEASIRQKIKALSQKTIDSSLNDSLGENFKNLKDTRRLLSETVSEMDNLRTRGFQEFKETIPQIKKKYETLRELTELNDLNEFNVLFKNTYPEIFRWQSNIRNTRNQREDISDKLVQDMKEVTRLNAEISKKLGSLKRSIEKSGQSLLTDKEKSKLKQLAKREQKMSQQTEDMKNMFNRMNQENPMLPPSLSQDMGQAGRNLKNAQKRLNSQQVQRGLDSENKALKSLQKTQDLLNEMKNADTKMSDRGKRETPLRLGTGSRRDPRPGGSVRMQKEKVLLPSEDQYKVPRAFREEILDAMKKQTPKNYERLVNEYYKELVQ